MHINQLRPRRLLARSLVAMAMAAAGMAAAAGAAPAQAAVTQATAPDGGDTAVTTAAAPSIIPAPVSMTTHGGPDFTVTAGTAIVTRAGSAAALPVARDLAADLRPSTGFRLPVVAQGSRHGQPRAHSIVLQLIKDTQLGQEGYTLNVAHGLALLRAVTPEGLFHGVQTLLQLLPAQAESTTAAPGPWPVPSVSITDYPRFAYRGALLDVGRHFFSVADVEKFIDILSLYKFNTLHLHLTDDQGWRIAMNAYPDLTSIGGSTEIGGGPGGYYTQQDYKDIVAYAAAHYITVVPEIDMPGHVGAALASVPDLNCDGVAPPITDSGPASDTLCVGTAATAQFVTDVLNELAAITPGSYIDIGGDEAFNTTAADYLAFENQTQQIAAATGKNIQGWEQISVADTLPPHTVIQHWSTDAASDALAAEGVSKGAKVVMSPSPLAYLNRQATIQAGYQWDPATFVSGVTESDVLGVETDLWTLSATVTGYPKATIDNLSDAETLMLPRGLDTAEMGWTPQQDRNWDDFSARVAAQEPRWQDMGLSYSQSPEIPWPVSLALGTAAPAGDGGTVSLTGTFTNSSSQRVSNVGVTLAAPQGWTVQPARAQRIRTVAPGSSASLTWQVSAPAGAPPGTAAVTAHAGYTLGAGTGVVTAQGSVPVAFGSLAASFDNVGITDDADTADGNIDGSGSSMSAQALASAGVSPSSTLAIDGSSFSWPDVPAGQADNTVASGQAIAVGTSGSTLAFLASTANGAVSGTGTVTYTDGSTQTFTLTAPGWCCSTATPGSAVITAPYRNRPGNTQDHANPTYVYYEATALDPGKVVADVVLPDISASDAVLHVFAMTVT